MGKKEKMTRFPGPSGMVVHITFRIEELREEKLAAGPISREMDGYELVLVYDDELKRWGVSLWSHPESPSKRDCLFRLKPEDGPGGPTAALRNFAGAMRKGGEPKTAALIEGIALAFV